ncbi:hypothetical protein PVAG01_03060 [Phlyctema vagabunda]|uniref:Uncharacterized protein n=1 Tax=Phlyctema vagabunda TaxID=108571 RepID=A0ABR4PSC6_9HELO
MVKFAYRFALLALARVGMSQVAGCNPQSSGCVFYLNQYLVALGDGGYTCAALRSDCTVIDGASADPCDPGTVLSGLGQGDVVVGSRGGSGDQIYADFTYNNVGYGLGNNHNIVDCSHDLSECTDLFIYFDCS